MKFKCTDCGCEYDEKPEYCDCGNNTFEQIEVVKEVPKKPVPQPKPQPTKQINQVKKDFDYIGWGVFFTCIILSILSVMFLGNGILEKAKNQQQAPKTVLQPTNNIPKIDSLWKTSTVTQQPVQPTETIKQVEQPQPLKIFAPKKETTKTQPAVTQKKVTPTKKTTTPAKTTKQQTSTTPKVDAQKYIPKTTSTEQTTVQKPKVDTATLQKELLQYKIALRNRIASKMDFAQVVGDGNCKITFKVNSAGTLTERKFAQQSPNDSLNDVVYSAMMQTPSYKVPPEGYKNETLTLSVKMYGGNFEIDLR